MAKRSTINSKMIAPCGMNCGICLAHLREKNHCDGCQSMSNGAKKDYSRKCIIRNCRHLQENGWKYCYKCAEYPCKRLKALDKRYRTKYRMSMIENLANIEENGIRQFVRDEKERWACPHCGGTINVHRFKCSDCGDSKCEK